MPNLDVPLFYIFALLTLAGAVLTISLRNAVHCAVSLILSLLGIAGLYLLQQAEFLFAVQIVLYVGGIMVLFLFVIMLVNLEEAAGQRQARAAWWVAAAAVAGVGAQALYFMAKGASAWPWSSPAPEALTGSAAPGNVQAIADVLFTEYLVPFEVASVLLLVAIVGAVFLARKGA
ncbi:MAG: NADH-quinone oxidoreductase subunit J [Acidobacteria bacterium]|nr:NADH-quinone oxidoreductase subunit J [Acidobacteriota bacterium]MBI3279078.1 NADH-quinone oxidoreductase subunit J [Acidobacteriota bacterium]